MSEQDYQKQVRETVTLHFWQQMLAYAVPETTVNFHVGLVTGYMQGLQTMWQRRNEVFGYIVWVSEFEYVFQLQVSQIA